MERVVRAEKMKIWKGALVQRKRSYEMSRLSRENEDRGRFVRAEQMKI
jgi:hypothetical protein